MVFKEELKIIDVFRKDLFRTYTLRELQKLLHKKSYNWMHKAIAKLSKTILTAKKAGITILVNANTNNPLLITYFIHLDRLEALNNRKIPQDIILNIINTLVKQNPFFVLLVTGSYVTGDVRKNSDLDLVVIVQDDNQKKLAKAYISDATQFSDVNVEPHIMAKEEFIEMLTREEENFGKQVYKKRLLFYGADIYYQIIKEAIKHGFRG